MLHDVIFISSFRAFETSIVVAAYRSLEPHIHYFFFIRPCYYYRFIPALWSDVFAMSHCTTIRFPVARIHFTSKAYPRTAGFRTMKVSRSPFFHTRGKEEQRFHETVSKVADTGRGGGSRALVAWLDRHAALPRDTLLKQRTTLKFSESTGCVCKDNKS